MAWHHAVPQCHSLRAALLRFPQSADTAGRHVLLIRVIRVHPRNPWQKISSPDSGDALRRSHATLYLMRAAPIGLGGRGVHCIGKA